MVANYDHYSHEELFAMVTAGHPDQVEAVAAVWSGLAETTDDFARDLERDLGRLGAYWSGAAGAEYAKRIASMVRFSRDIATETGVLGSRLTVLAQVLREAQAKLEDPAATDDHDKAASYAATGAKWGSAAGPAGTLAGGVAGGVAGWFADDEEAEKAKARTVKLVKELAASYEVHGPANHVKEPTAPIELPQNVRGGVAAASAVGAGGVARYTGTRVGIGRNQVAHAPAPAGRVKPGTTQQGAEPVQVQPGEPAAPVGSGLTGAGDGGFRGVEMDPRTGQHGLGGGPGGLGRGPLDGSGVGWSPGARAPGVAGAARGTGLAGNVPAQVGPGRAPEAAVLRPAAPPAASLTAGRPVATGDDEPDERLTWLTEDEMAWGDGGPAVPSVLGGREAE